MKRDLTRGPVTKSMLLFAIPMILGDLLQQCYNIADTLIVGQVLGRDALNFKLTLPQDILIYQALKDAPLLSSLEEKNT